MKSILTILVCLFAVPINCMKQKVNLHAPVNFTDIKTIELMILICTLRTIPKSLVLINHLSKHGMVL